MKIIDKIRRFWLFRMANPVVREGEHGGFKWKFRRFWLEIGTLSGNFKGRWTASEHPFGYLVAGEDDDNIEGFCQMVYMVSMLLTTDQKFVNDVNKALDRYEKRMEKAKGDEEDDEEVILAAEKQVQEYAEMPEKERKKVEKQANRRLKDVQKRTNGDI